MAKEYEQNKSKKKIKLIIVIICLLLLVVGGAVGMYFALAPKESFDVHYKIKVHATVTGSYKLGGQEKQFGSITFDPKDKNQQANETLSVGKVALTTTHSTIEFTYTFENKDNKDMKVTLVDETLKNNVAIINTLYQGNEEIKGANLELGFIVRPSEVYSVKVKVSITDFEKDAIYKSDSEHSYSWVLVGVEE